MRGSQKSKRVSWASDGNLCQVRLFLSEENPSQVSLGAQDHLQAKASWMLHSSGLGSDENLPPGFEETTPSNQFKNKLSQILLSKWRCPPKCLLNISWQVVAGEESKEAEIENQREMRVLEAVYPRQSAIPPNPAGALEIDGAPSDDRHTLLIPLTPIEEDDGVADTTPGIASGSFASNFNAPAYPTNNISAGMALGVEPNVLNAASVAAATMMKNSEQGTSIDRDLLIKIFSNPHLVEKLVTDHGMAANPQAISTPIPSQTTLPGPPLYLHINRPDTNHPSSAGTLNGSFYPPPNGHASAAPPGYPVPSAPIVGAPMLKDLNYYKSLIQKHGGERDGSIPRNNQEPASNSKLIRDSKPKVNKPCMYFNSSRGCRNGANCAFQHDSSFQQRGGSIQEVQNAKRMKMDREITGTQSCS